MVIGFFDSGVGGLSILSDVQRLMPNISTVYFGDTKNFPYGTKSEEQVREFSLEAIDVLMEHKPSAIVVACNTASTSALFAMREYLPNIPIIGVVPALKPAVAQTKTKKVAVLATQRTLDSVAYHDLKKVHGDGVTIIDQACPGWVEVVESHQINNVEAAEQVRGVIEPLVQQGVDSFVLGCTHYPFLRLLIEKYSGSSAQIFDSGQAIAQQLQRVVATTERSRETSEIFLCSGDTSKFLATASALLGREIIMRK